MISTNYIQEILKENRLSAILVTHPANIIYTSGFTSPQDAVVLITTDSQYLITDTRYEFCAPYDVFENFEVIIARETSVFDTAKEMIKEFSGKVAFEGWALSVENHKKFPANKMTADAGRMINILREEKIEEELINIELAAKLTDKAYEFAVSNIKSGVSERKLALMIEFFIRDHGGELAFPTIVAAGKNSAYPHAIPSNYCFTPGDLIIMDLGAKVNNYCADLTRTVALKKASEKAKDIYSTCLRAQIIGINTACAGVCTKYLNDTAYNAIEKAGYGEYIMHSLGHGVGLEVHEAPTIGKRTKQMLHENNIITIEPGIYIEGFGGVRIEDLVRINDKGCAVLSKAEKAGDLLII